MELIFTYCFYFFIAIVLINVGYSLFFFFFAFAKASTQDKQSKEEQSDKATGIIATDTSFNRITSLPPVSIIVCSKNEAENLRNNIPKWLSQQYHNFELVLINDASWDDTQDIIEAAAVEDTRISQVHVENIEAFWGSKKYALTLGIKKAKHEHLLFTDADCVPASEYWLQEMASSFTDRKQLVLGYGGYEKVKGSFLNKLIRYETVLTAMQYFSYGMAGNPYMGVGRNLAYTKALFFEHSGFMSHMQIPAGDDDLFVNEAGTKHNVAFQYKPEAFTLSIPKKSFKSWFIQKKRHVHIAKHYKKKDTFFLGLYWVSQFLFFLCAALLLAFQFKWEYVLGLIGLRYVFKALAVGGSAFKLKERDVFYLFPVYELCLICFQMSIFMANLMTKPTRWK